MRRDPKAGNYWDTLVRGTSRLEMDPIPWNHDSVERLWQAYARGYPFTAQLEPGDSTRYSLLIVPLHNANTAFGYDERHMWQHYLISRVVGGEAVATVHRRAWVRNMDQHDAATLSLDNGWTQELLTWWLTGFDSLITDPRRNTRLAR